MAGFFTAPFRSLVLFKVDSDKSYPTTSISNKSNSNFLCLQVCTHIAQCYRVASGFEKCREMIQEIPTIVKELSRILYYKVRMKPHYVSKRS